MEVAAAFSALLLAALLQWPAPTAGQSTTAAPTTVSVYVPGYAAEDWLKLRGSVLSSNSTETAYTIFCADPDTEHCQIAGDLPFTFAEGPSTLYFSGADPGVITASLACDLQGTTEAACTGSSSFGTAYADAGSTSTSWSKTLTGSEVQWGVLTLSTPAPETDAGSGSDSGRTTRTTESPEKTVTPAPNPTDTAWFFTTSTSDAASATATGSDASLEGQARILTLACCFGLAMAWILT